MRARDMGRGQLQECVNQGPRTPGVNRADLQGSVVSVVGERGLREMLGEGILPRRQNLVSGKSIICSKSINKRIKDYEDSTQSGAGDP